MERQVVVTGMRTLTHLMGLAPCAIAVQSVIDGIRPAEPAPSGGTAWPH